MFIPKTITNRRAFFLFSILATCSDVGVAQESQLAPLRGLNKGDAVSQFTNSFPSKPEARLVRMQNDNPFLLPSNLSLQAPDFAHIQHEHYLPAFEAGMKQQLAEVHIIAELAEPPTFENTLVSLEKSGEILERVQAVFFNMTTANTDKKIQEIEEKIAPRLASHSDDIYLNKKLFARVEILWQQRTKQNWNEEQQRLVKEYYENFVRAGAKLNDEQQTRVRAINEEVSSLTTQFQQNLLAITKERSVVVDNIALLDGMSAADIAAAKEAAKTKGHDGKYLLAITNTTRQPVLLSLKNRDVRKPARRRCGQPGRPAPPPRCWCPRRCR